MKKLPNHLMSKLHFQLLFGKAFESMTLDAQDNMLRELQLLLAKERDLTRRIKEYEQAAPDNLYVDRVVEVYTPKAGNRAWTSSSPDNDHQAITIEVANDSGEPNWHVSDAALEATINLCVDICKRNGIEKLNFTGDKSGNLTMHKYFAATGCPGPYLSSKFPYIASEVNKRLGAGTSSTTTEQNINTSGNIKVGDIVRFKGGNIYVSSTAKSTTATRGASRCIMPVFHISGTKKFPNQLTQSCVLDFSADDVN